jgi:hypothetical protein
MIKIYIINDNAPTFRIEEKKRKKKKHSGGFPCDCNTITYIFKVVTKNKFVCFRNAMTNFIT